MNSFTEENYLKAIFKLSQKTTGGVSTNAIAETLETKASSAITTWYTDIFNVPINLS